MSEDSSQPPPPKKPKPSIAFARKAGKHYVQAEAQTSNKLRLLIMAHDGAISAARNENAQQVKRVMELLIKGLDFDKETIFAIGQLRVYKHCIRAAEQGHFKEVTHLMTQMRDAWEELYKSGNAS